MVRTHTSPKTFHSQTSCLFIPFLGSFPSILVPYPLLVFLGTRPARPGAAFGASALGKLILLAWGGVSVGKKKIQSLVLGGFHLLRTGSICIVLGIGVGKFLVHSILRFHPPSHFNFLFQ